MAELVALRAILLDVLYKLANGKELTAEERLNALLQVDNLVVPFSFPYLAPVKAQPGFIPRFTGTVRAERFSLKPTRLA